MNTEREALARDLDCIDVSSLKVPSEPPEWFCKIWAQFEAERAADVPNRLHGAAINAEGDAI